MKSAFPEVLMLGMNVCEVMCSVPKPKSHVLVESTTALKE